MSKPVVILDFSTPYDLNYFLKLYSKEVLSSLRASANESPPTHELKFQLPPSSLDPLYPKNETPRSFAVFTKAKEFENCWIYYFSRIE